MTSPLRVLHESGDEGAGRRLASEELTAFYGDELRLPEATPMAVIANFVTTVDGITTFDRDRARGAAAVSGGSEADRLLMAMLRAAADVILIGAGTLRVTIDHRWTAAALAPALAAPLGDVRLQLTGSSEPAPLVVVSAGGEVPADHPGLHLPGVRAMIITTEQGARRLAPAAAGIQVVAAAESGPIPPQDLLAIIQRELSPRLLLTEGGPLLFGSLLSANLVNELFLTVTPVIAGRSPSSHRPGLVDGFEAAPPEAPRLALLSLRQAEAGPLFFRYRLGTSQSRAR